MSPDARNLQRNVPDLVITEADDDSEYFSEKYVLLARAYHMYLKDGAHAPIFRLQFLMNSTREMEQKAALARRAYWKNKFAMLFSSLKAAYDQL